MLQHIAKLLFIFAIIFSSQAYAKKTHRPEVLIVYDNAGFYGHLGKTNAILLENLLGHFDAKVKSEPVVQYKSTDMKGKRAVFYIGSTYNPLGYYTDGSQEKNAYMTFFKDVATQNKTVIWMNYNLNLLKWSWDANQWAGTSMEEKFGFTFQYTNPSIKYNRVTYKNTELYKGVVPFATPGSDISHCLQETDHRYACALELVPINISNRNKVTIYASAYSTELSTTQADPYITKGSNNFWFVGDIPFTYMSEEDRYLAFSDVLHDMLNIPHKEVHHALMRLEDVDARTEITDLENIANLAKQKNVRFSVATIAQYRDPFGIENGGKATAVNLYDSIIGQKLKELYNAKRIDIVAHGFTHQFGNLQNPYNGLSGDDFEFMRVVENNDSSYSYLYPTMGDSGLYAYWRMYTAKRILAKTGLKAFAWEAPHYMAGPNHYRAIKYLYPVQYARVLYYPQENSTDTSKKYKFIGQFYPYLIQHDIYGTTVIPEDIHNIEDAPNAGYRPLAPSDTIRFAKKLKVVRDGIASFYYHPYLGTGPLTKIIDGLRNVGYTFVSAPSLLKK